MLVKGYNRTKEREMTVSEIINMGFSLHKEGNLEDAENKYNEALNR